MSEKLIPEHIDPFRFAEQQLHLIGIVNISDMKRLEAALQSSDSVVAVDLKFGVDEQSITFLKGHLKTKLTLQCQRCLEPFVYEIISNFALGIVNTLDEAKALPELYEPALAKEGKLALRELIEDEVILNLPIIPKHGADECEVNISLSEAEEKQEKRDNPFKVLESLKDKRK